MFTGIVKELGTVKKVIREQGKVHLCVTAKTVFNNATIDDSISVNGCCLTVVDLKSNVASFDVLPETLNKTNIGLLKEDDIVNLEESLTLQTKLGGHIIQGHVDCTARVISYEIQGESTIISFSLPKHFLDMMVTKAFVSIDGISLTIVDVTDTYFSVMIIPHTKQITIAGYWKVNTLVNIEIDIINKSIFQYLNKLNIIKNCK